jgi:transposase
MGHIEGVDRNQLVLFPEALDEYISADNPVRFVDAFVDSLDPAALGFQHAVPKDTGRPPYHPRDLLKLFVYGYLNRLRSSRLLEKEAGRNVELMWLLRKLTPDFKTIADFGKDNRQAIRKVCRVFTLYCRELGPFGGALVGIDGSKFKAVKRRDRQRPRCASRTYPEDPPAMMMHAAALLSMLPLPGADIACLLPYSRTLGERKMPPLQRCAHPMLPKISFPPRQSPPSIRPCTLVHPPKALYHSTYCTLPHVILP